MSTVENLLAEQVETLKAENAKLQERIKTVEATNRELRKENNGLNQDSWSLKEEVKQLNLSKARFDKLDLFIKSFKEVFEIAGSDHDHDDKYRESRY